MFWRNSLTVGNCPTSRRRLFHIYGAAWMKASSPRALVMNLLFFSFLSRIATSCSLYFWTCSVRTELCVLPLNMVYLLVCPSSPCLSLLCNYPFYFFPFSCPCLFPMVCWLLYLAYWAINSVLECPIRHILQHFPVCWPYIKSYEVMFCCTMGT